MKNRGVFITLEGIEGTGKSTQARLLNEALKDEGRRTLLTVEPGGTRIGERIRGVLLDPGLGEMDPLTELLLYNASRVQHLRECIFPALSRGQVVICDRFSDSTLAYQGFGRGLDMALIRNLDLLCTGGFRPDLTLLLDLDVEEGLTRNRDMNKTDRLEREAVEFHRRVREGFHRLREEEPARIRLFDASRGIEEVHREIRAAVAGLLGGVR